jgi:hypothetical protein
VTLTDHLRIADRFTYHAPTPDQIPLYEEIRNRARLLAVLLGNICPPSQELTMAVNSLDQMVMWANASIARHDVP